MRESKREEVKEKVDKTPEKIQIQEEELEKIREEMEDNKNKNNEKNDKKFKEALKNIAIGCGIIIYFAILLFSKDRIPRIDYIKAIKVIIVFDLLASLVLLEVGFRKDKFKIGVHGIEMSLVGAFTILLLDLVSKMSNSFNIIFSIIVGSMAIYYMVKSTIIVIKKEK